MLTFVEGVPEGAVTEAAEFARYCFDAEGDDRPLRVARKPLVVYAATGIGPEAFELRNLVGVGYRFAVLDERHVVGFVTVDSAGAEPVAVSMEFVEPSSATLAALAIADVSAERTGLREVRVIQIPVVDAAFFWVTGSDPEFVDQIEGGTYDEKGFVGALRDRLAVKRNPPADFSFLPDDTPDPTF